MTTLTYIDVPALCRHISDRGQAGGKIARDTTVDEHVQHTGYPVLARWGDVVVCRGRDGADWAVMPHPSEARSTWSIILDYEKLAALNLLG